MVYMQQREQYRYTAGVKQQWDGWINTAEQDKHQVIVIHNSTAVEYAHVGIDHVQLGITGKYIL